MPFKPVRLTPDRAGSGEPRRASGSVPLVSWEAVRAVRAEPLSAGKVAGNLASGIVPLRSVAGIVVVVLGLATPAATVCFKYPALKAPRFTSAVRLGFAVATT